jgi:hypothetical protein
VNGEKGRLPIPTTVPDDEQALPLARSVAAAICENRELLVTPSLVEELRKQRRAGPNEADTAALSNDSCRHLLTELMRRGFGVGRVRAPFQPQREESAPLSAARLFEDTIAGGDALGIKLRFGVRPVIDEASAKPKHSAGPRTLAALVEGVLGKTQENLFWELGVILPQVKLEQGSSLCDDEFQLQVNDLRLEPNGFGQDGAEEPADFVARTVEGALRKNAGAFLTTELVTYNLDLLRSQSPALVDAARRFDVVTLTRILRSLVDEELSVRDLEGILENLLAVNGATAVDFGKYVVFAPHTASFCPAAREQGLDSLGTADYVEALRASLKRYISNKYSKGSNTLLCYLLDRAIEARVLRMPNEPLGGEEREELLNGIFEETRYGPGTGAAPVILTSALVRRPLRNLIEKEFPWLAVLSYQELAPELTIQPLGRISAW